MMMRMRSDEVEPAYSSNDDEEEQEMRITVHGAGGSEVTGSAYYLLLHNP
jgi:hypothetical protein